MEPTPGSPAPAVAVHCNRFVHSGFCECDDVHLEFGAYRGPGRRSHGARHGRGARRRRVPAPPRELARVSRSVGSRRDLHRLPLPALLIPIVHASRAAARFQGWRMTIMSMLQLTRRASLTPGLALAVTLSLSATAALAQPLGDYRSTGA